MTQGQVPQPQTDLDFSSIRENVRKSRWQFYVSRFLKIAALIVGVWILAIVAVLLFNAKAITAAVGQAKAAKADLEAAQHQIVNRDFTTASDSLGRANTELLSVQGVLKKLPLIRWTPFLRQDVFAVDNLLVVGVNLSDSGKKLLVIADDITSRIKNESLPNSKISKERKIEIVQKLVAAEPIFIEVQTELKQANDAMAKVNTKRLLLRPISKSIQPLKDYLPVITRMVDQSVPLLTAMPKILGFEKPETYLFLIQNNHELRPTGGFIGTYGVVKFDAGDLAELRTDNIYNLDRAFAEYNISPTPQQLVNEPSPAPIQKWLEQKQWALRDINWDPDFPTTAQKAIEIYGKENTVAQQIELKYMTQGGKRLPTDFKTAYPTEDFGGLIAITPEVIEGLLRITGPITVDGVNFTADNFQDELEFRVGFEYRQLGIKESERKDIIHSLADELQARISAMPYTRLLDVMNVFFDSLAGKAILLYSTDESLQKQITDRGWAGEINQSSLDYLFVVDSNLASLKSDQFVDRFVNYKLRKQNGDYIAEVTVTHKHNGEFAWNSSRLRSYTRVYAPLGSTLISSKGAMDNDKIREPEQKPGTVDVSQEHGKTVFGAFFVTEPKETTSLTFTYKLPANIGQQIEKGSYNLLYQKQPGTNHHLTLDLDFAKTIGNSVPQNQSANRLSGSVYKSDELIKQDSWYVIGF